MKVTFLFIVTVLGNILKSSGEVSDPPVRKTLSGKVRGHVVTSADKQPVDEFLGIPFAEPPIGKRRFDVPHPKHKWTGILDTRRYGPSCLQIEDSRFKSEPAQQMWLVNNEIEEDCLYLNVWTAHPRPKKHPVMVWIYGGSFNSGSSSLDIYNGKTLASRNGVVVVSFNYRLGALGFLSTGDGRVKGNFGMMDQVMALKWVKENIEAFGGDPSAITIFGESAGAASVTYHLLSPMSRNLFKRAIIQSGSANAIWAYTSPEEAKAYSTKFFEKIGCADDDDILNCLRDETITQDDIEENQSVDTDRGSSSKWKPTVAEPFLPRPPQVMLNEKDIKPCRVLMGITEDEGTYFMLSKLPFKRNDQVNGQSVENIKNAISIFDSDLPAEFQNEIFEYYTKDINVSDEVANRDAITELVGDRNINCPLQNVADTYAASGASMFYYHYTHRSSNEKWPDWMGVVHAAEVPYVFGWPRDEARGYTDDERRLSDIIMTYWTNFVKHGDPTGASVSVDLPTWPLYNLDTKEYLELNLQTKHRSKGVRDKQCKFWKEIKEKSGASSSLQTSILFWITSVGSFTFLLVWFDQRWK